MNFYIIEKLNSHFGNYKSILPSQEKTASSDSYLTMKRKNFIFFHSFKKKAKGEQIKTAEMLVSKTEVMSSSFVVYPYVSKHFTQRTKSSAA